MSSLDSAASSEGRPALRLLLLGRTGSGRSASGNTLLGRSAFPSAASTHSVTRRCQTHSGAVMGRSLAVTDTPGFFHTDLSPREVTEELLRGLRGPAAPGPHALLLTLRLGQRYTQEERRALGWLRAVLGPRALEFTLLLLTWGEEGLRGHRPEDFLEESEELREFAGSCRGGWHLLENRGGEQEQEQEQEQAQDQVQELLEKVERMVEENAGGFYSNEMLRDAEREVQEERILGGEKSCEDPGEEEMRRGGREEVELRRGGREERRGEERRWRSVDDRGRREEEEERKREEEAARRKEEREFWAELLTAVGRGAAEGAGLLEKGAGPAGKRPGIGKTLKKVGTMATTPMSITSAARVVGGAVREGGRVLFKHRKTLTQK